MIIELNVSVFDNCCTNLSQQVSDFTNQCISLFFMYLETWRIQKVVVQKSGNADGKGNMSVDVGFYRCVYFYPKDV